MFVERMEVLEYRQNFEVELTREPPQPDPAEFLQIGFIW